MEEALGWKFFIFNAHHFFGGGGGGGGFDIDLNPPKGFFHNHKNIEIFLQYTKSYVFWYMMCEIGNNNLHDQYHQMQFVCLVSASYTLWVFSWQKIFD